MSSELLESERAVIGCLLIDSRIADTLAAQVEPRDFLSDDLGRVYGFLLDAREAGKPITDARAVHAELKRAGLLDAIGGVAGIARLVRDTPNVANANYHASTIRRGANLRRLAALGQLLVDGANDPQTQPADLIAQVDAMAAQVAAGESSQGTVTIQQATVAAIERADRARQGKSGVAVPSGIHSLDQTIGGFFPGELVVLAARPSIGKSALAAQIASHNAMRQRSVLLVSLEMDAASIANRELAAEIGSEVRAIRNGVLTDQQRAEAERYAAELEGVPYEIYYGRNATVSRIRGLSRIIAAKPQGLALVVVDYLGLITANDRRKPRWEQITEISGALKTLALELQVPILALSQLNRDAENRPPTLAQLRDSGAIEQDADVVMLLHRESRDAEEAELNIAKNRNGATGAMTLSFDPATTTFSDASLTEWAP
jgi:replicative DNA helicase